MIRPLALLAAAALAACAQAPVQKQAWTETVGPTSKVSAEETSLNLTARAVAAGEASPGVSKPDACEAAARRQIATSPEKAWAALKSCVDRTRFLSLAKLLEGPWADELRRRPDAPLFLARLVAARGGNTYDDLASLRKARVPLFGLEPAMTTPEMFTGRTILFRARVESVKLLGGSKASARLSHLELGSRAKFVDTGRGFRVNTTSQESHSGSASGAYEARDRGRRRSGEYSAHGRSDESSSASDSATLEVRRFVNELHETGRSIILRMGAPDPFFEPGKDFVMVGRFDGLRAEASQDMEQAEQLAVVTLLGFYEASGENGD